MSASHDKKKEAIIRAAGIVFAQKGFHQAKMDEIAQMAKVAKGTLYYNYASKSKLFGATVTQGLNQIMDAISKEIDADIPFDAHFQRIIATIVNLYITNSEVMRIYANEMSSGIEEEVLVEIKNVRKKFNTFVEDQLTFGQEKGYIRRLPPHLSALAVIGIIDTLCSHYIENPDHDTLDEIVDTVVTILSNGLARTS